VTLAVNLIYAVHKFAPVDYKPGKHWTRWCGNGTHTHTHTHTHASRAYLTGKVITRGRIGTLQQLFFTYLSLQFPIQVCFAATVRNWLFRLCRPFCSQSTSLRTWHPVTRGHRTWSKPRQCQEESACQISRSKVILFESYCEDTQLINCSSRLLKWSVILQTHNRTTRVILYSHTAMTLQLLQCTTSEMPHRWKEEAVKMLSSKTRKRCIQYSTPTPIGTKDSSSSGLLGAHHGLEQVVTNTTQQGC